MIETGLYWVVNPSSDCYKLSRCAWVKLFLLCQNRGLEAQVDTQVVGEKVKEELEILRALLVLVYIVKRNKETRNMTS